MLHWTALTPERVWASSQFLEVAGLLNAAIVYCSEAGVQALEDQISAARSSLDHFVLLPHGPSDWQKAQCLCRLQVHD